MSQRKTPCRSSRQRAPAEQVRIVEVHFLWSERRDSRDGVGHSSEQKPSEKRQRSIFIMRLVTNEANFAAQSRVAAIRLGVLSLRIRLGWAELFGDPDGAAIMVAVAVIRSERLLRQELTPEQKTLAVPLQGCDLGTCNVASIAAASGFNRETARRKLSQLVTAGLLVREGDEFNFSPGLTQDPRFRATIHELLECLRRIANDLLRTGIFEFSNS